MDEPTPTDATRAAPVGEEWRRAERRVRTLSRIQLVVALVIALTAMAVAAFVGVRLEDIEAERARLSEMSQAVLTARSDMHAAQEEAWRVRAGGPRTTDPVRPSTADLRLRVTGLARRSADVHPDSARIARTAAEHTGVAIDEIDRGRFSTLDSAVVDAADTALARWAETLHGQQEQGAGRRLGNLAQAVGTGMIALALLIGAAAVLGWLLLERARRRMAGEFADALTEQESLYRTATSVAGLTDLDAVLDHVAVEAARLLHAHRAAVVRYLPGGSGEMVGASDGGTPLYDGLVPLTGVGSVARVYREGGPTQVDDYLLHVDDPVCARMAEKGMRSSIAAAIDVDGERWGALICFSRAPYRFADRDGALLERYGRLAGLAVGNAASHARLAAQASADPLTGLPNHRAFRERLETEADRARRHGRELSLVLVDVDRFTQVNAALGHRGGDRLLVDLAHLLEAGARSSDTVARIGGQEFAILMPECDSWGAWTATERVRGAVARGPLGGLEGQSVSAGVCDLTQAGGSAERLLELASGALYWAKQHGRDLCVRYSPEVVTDLSATERAARLERARALDAVRLLAQAVDAREPNTQRHSERVAAIAAELAREIGWDADDVRLLREAALVHDVGKIGVPDSVLLKPGPLTPEERGRMEAHAALGAQMVTDVLAAEQVAWIHAHHERWDGAGYPDRLAGDAIPAGARILTVADCFDAMTSDRPYRSGMPAEAAQSELVAGSGTQFAPEVVEAFTRIARSGRLDAALHTTAA